MSNHRQWVQLDPTNGGAIAAAPDAGSSAAGAAEISGLADQPAHDAAPPDTPSETGPVGTSH